MHPLDRQRPALAGHFRTGKLSGASAFIAALAVGLLAFFMPTKDWLPSAQTIKLQLDGFGLAAPLIFVVGTALLAAFGAPRLLLYSIAGVAFGAAWGLVWSLLGTLLGAYSTFLTVRALGRGPILRRFPALARYSGRIRKRGFLAVLLVRQLPMNGFYNNLLLGLSPVRHRDFLLGSLLGYLPMGMAAAAIGAGVVQADLAQLLQYAGMGGAAFVIVGLLLKRLVRTAEGKLEDSRLSAPNGLE